MRMTVGPLPPAVYWRRRFVLLAVVLLVLFGFSRCVLSASGDEKPTAKTSRSASPTPGASSSDDPDGPDDRAGAEPGGASPGASASTSAEPGGTAGGGALGDGSTGGSSDGAPGGADPAGAPVDPATGDVPSPAPAGPDRLCAAGELVVTASPERTEYQVGTMPRLRLTVRNAAATACTTDLGATRQELRVTSGGARIWSSDDCNPTRGSDIVVLAPGAQRTFTMTWSGKTSTPRCSTPRVRAGAGTYRVWARLGGTLSAPVVFRLV